jgi:hypothetical protein
VRGSAKETFFWGASIAFIESVRGFSSSNNFSAINASCSAASNVSGFSAMILLLMSSLSDVM